MADAPITPFVMHGAREAVSAGMLHISQQVEGIERAVNENTGLAFDLAKTLIESACKSILSERGIPYSPATDLPALFKTVRDNLSFLPLGTSYAAEVNKSLKKTLNGLHTAVLGVCELRSQCGFASHGSEGPRPVMESIQALLAAETADAIVGFLQRVNKQNVEIHKKLSYKDNPDFNEYIDENNVQVLIFSEEFEPE